MPVAVRFEPSLPKGAGACRERVARVDRGIERARIDDAADGIVARKIRAGRTVAHVDALQAERGRELIVEPALDPVADGVTIERGGRFVRADARNSRLISSPSAARVAVH